MIQQKASSRQGCQCRHVALSAVISSSEAPGCHPVSSDIVIGSARLSSEVPDCHAVPGRLSRRCRRIILSTVKSPSEKEMKGCHAVPGRISRRCWRRSSPRCGGWRRRRCTAAWPAAGTPSTPSLPPPTSSLSCCRYPPHPPRLYTNLLKSFQSCQPNLTGIQVRIISYLSLQVLQRRKLLLSNICSKREGCTLRNCA